MTYPVILRPFARKSLRAFLFQTVWKLPARKRRLLLRAGLRALFLKKHAGRSPMFLQVEPTTRCNLSCAHCPRVLRDVPGQDMDVDAFMRLVDENPDALFLHLQGLGEPLLHDRFCDMVKYATQRGMLVGTCTNGHVLSAALLAALKDSGLAYLAFSLDAAGPRLGEMRQGASIDAVTSHLETIARARSPGLLLAFWVVVQRRNLDEMDAVISLAARYGIDHILFSFIHDRYATPSTGDSLLGTENPHALKLLRSRLVTRCRTEGLLSSFSVAQPAGRLVHCRWPWAACSILVDGRVVPCCLTRDEHVFGNAFEERLDRIWGNAAYDQFRRDLKNGALPVACRRCQYL